MFFLSCPVLGLVRQLQKVVKALGKTWHDEHFTCSGPCKKPMSTQPFFEKEGKVYCKPDYEKLFAAKCEGCQNPITDNTIVALNAKWHKDCFVCKVTRYAYIFFASLQLNWFEHSCILKWRSRMVYLTFSMNGVEKYYFELFLSFSALFITNFYFYYFDPVRQNSALGICSFSPGAGSALLIPWIIWERQGASKSYC